MSIEDMGGPAYCVSAKRLVNLGIDAKDMVENGLAGGAIGLGHG